MGTMSEAIDYKSPEQVRSEDFDFLSDLWQIVSVVLLSGYLHVRDDVRTLPLHEQGPLKHGACHLELSP